VRTSPGDQLLSLVGGGDRESKHGTAEDNHSSFVELAQSYYYIYTGGKTNTNEVNGSLNGCALMRRCEDLKYSWLAPPTLPALHAAIQIDGTCLEADGCLASSMMEVNALRSYIQY